MKQQQLLFLIAVIMMICFGCKKDSETPSTGLADSAVGVYSGNWDVSSMSVPGTCEVVKVSGTTVDLKMTVAGQSIPSFPTVKISDGGNGKIILSYSDPSGQANGTIQNKTIILTMDDGTTTLTFSGTKP